MPGNATSLASALFADQPQQQARPQPGNAHSSVALASALFDSGSTKSLADEQDEGPRKQLYLSPAELRAYDRAAVTEVCSPSQNAAAASAAALASGETVLVPRAPSDAAQWGLVFIQARGWSFVPTAALPEIEAESSATRTRRVSQVDAESTSDERYRVVRELLQTEESYGAAIGLVKTSMLGPLREGDILPEVQLMKIFSCVSDLVELSEGLRKQLQAAAPA